MGKKQMIKRFMVMVISAVMALGAVSTAWAGNVYGDDGSHIKIMTSAGESTSLPKTNFNGMQVSLLPEDTKIWISSEGSTAKASTIFFYHGICAKNTLTNLERITDTRLYGDSATNPLNLKRLQYDKQFSAFPVCDHPEPHDPRNSVYVILLEDTEDFSWQRFFYILDDGSYPIIPTESANDTNQTVTDETLAQQGLDYTHPIKNVNDSDYAPNIEIGNFNENIDADGIAHGWEGDKPGCIWVPNFGYMSGIKIGYMG